MELTTRVLGRYLLVVVLLAGCGRDEALRGHVSRGGVDVVAALGTDEVTVTLTPQHRGFHVYSVDLPDEGVDGLGLPTRIRVAGSLRAEGDLRADRPVRQLDYPSLGLRLPVYPDGPVTFRLPVERGEGTPRVRVGFAACSESRCLPPVRDLEVPLAQR